MSALLSAVSALLKSWLVGIAGELVQQWRHDRTVADNALLEAQIRSRKAIDRAKKTVERRDLDAVRDRLRERADKR